MIEGSSHIRASEITRAMIASVRDTPSTFGVWFVGARFVAVVVFTSLLFGSCSKGSQIGHSCGKDDDCESGLVCIHLACVAESGTRETGRSCLADVDCKEGLLCVEKKCKTPHFLSIGATCTRIQECPDESICSSNAKICTAFGTVDDGQFCDQTNVCLAGSRCLGHRCSAGRLGQNCVAGTCVRGLQCIRGTCSDGGHGTPCEVHSGCKEGLFCNHGTCEGRKNAREPCMENAECNTKCTCFDGLCIVKNSIKDGEVCSGPEQCHEGSVCFCTGFLGYCDGPSKCGKRKYLGEICKEGDLQHFCDEGLFCCGEKCVENTTRSSVSVYGPCQCSEQCEIPERYFCYKGECTRSRFW